MDCRNRLECVVTGVPAVQNSSAVRSICSFYRERTVLYLHPTRVMAESAEKQDRKSIARNRRARHDYQILDTWEAGIVLTGSEVKSLRDGKANISDAYGVVKDGEVHLLNLHISPYEQASYFNHEPTRTRKLLQIGRASCRERGGE